MVLGIGESFFVYVVVNCVNCWIGYGSVVSNLGEGDNATKYIIPITWKLSSDIS